MQIDKDLVIGFIRSKLGDSKAVEAEGALPDQVDTDRDGDLLSRFGIDVGDLVKMATSGGLGNLPGGLGDAAGKLGKLFGR